MACTETIRLSLHFILLHNLVSLSADLFVGRLQFFFLNLTNGDAIRLNGQILDTCLHKMQPLFSRLPVLPSPCSDTKLCRSATYGVIHWTGVTCVT